MCRRRLLSAGRGGVVTPPRPFPVFHLSSLALRELSPASVRERLKATPADITKMDELTRPEILGSGQMVETRCREQSLLHSHISMP
jgi:hypothetical protein